MSGFGPTGHAPTGALDAAAFGALPALALAEASGLAFLAVEIEHFAAGSDATPLGEPTGAVPTGALAPEAQSPGGVQILRASDNGWVTRPDDPDGLHVYPPILLDGIDLDRAMDLAPGGQGAAAAWGALGLASEAGALDALVASRNADGQAVRIRLGWKVALDHPPRLDAALPLIAPGYEAPQIEWARAHTPAAASATARGLDGVTWVEWPQGGRRRQGSAQRLLVEGGRTNLTPNPRAEGFTAGVIGAGGVLPAGWVRDAAGGLTWEIIGGGTMAELPYVEIRLNGTTNSTGSVLRFMAPATPAIGPSYTSAVSLALVDGATANISAINSRIVVTGGTGNANAAFSLGGLSASAWQRVPVATVAGAGAASMANAIQIVHASGVAIDVTLRIAAPQLELGVSASTPILSPPGLRVAATRGDDALVATLASLNIPPGGTCTLIGTAMVPAAAPAGLELNLAEISGATLDDAFRLRVAAGGASVLAGRVTGGVPADAPSLGSVTPGVLFRWSLAIDGGGTIEAGLDAGPTESVGGGPVAGLTALRLGRNLFGELGVVRLVPWYLPPGQQRAARLALPE